MSEFNATRIRLPEKHEADASLGPLYDRADAAFNGSTLPGPTLFGNQVRALAHNPALLKALFAVYEAFAEQPSIDRKLTELGILVVSRVNSCRYCVQHHAPLAHGAGLTTAQLQALQDDAWSDRALWSEDEWLVVRFAEAIAAVPQRVDDKLFAALKKRFSERQIVDLTMRLALCAAWNKFNDALGLDTETAFQHAFAELGVA
jgi:uncharacterized peroxidase-related enzyme